MKNEGALERILKPEFELAAARDRQCGFEEVRSCQRVNLVESVGANDSRNVGKEIWVVEGVEQFHAQS